MENNNIKLPLRIPVEALLTLNRYGCGPNEIEQYHDGKFVLLQDVQNLVIGERSAPTVGSALTDADIDGLYHASQGQALREQDAGRVRKMARAVEAFLLAARAAPSVPVAVASNEGIHPLFELWWNARDIYHSIKDYDEPGTVPMNRDSALMRSLGKSIDATQEMCHLPAEPAALAAPIDRDSAKCVFRGAEALGLCVGICTKLGRCIEASAAQRAVPHLSDIEHSLQYAYPDEPVPLAVPLPDQSKLARELTASRALCDQHFATILELRAAADSAVPLPADQSALRAALQKIIDCVPAHNSDVGGFFVEHHGPDGEYLGSQQINPDDIIQEMQSIAANAIATTADPAAALPLPAGPTTWQSMATAPKDGTMLRLLVAFTDNATEDSAEPCLTIGANSLDNTGIDTWQFAGWDWQQDCFTEGAGSPVGWLPLAGAALPVGPSEQAPRDNLDMTDFIADYEWRTDEFCHTPTELEREMLHDFVAMMSEEFRLAVAPSLPVAVQQPTGLSKAHLAFIDSVIEVAFEGPDLDGGTIQEWAEKAGLLEARMMTEPCTEGQNCRCADGNDFPLTCYQKTYRADSAAIPVAERPIDAPQDPLKGEDAALCRAIDALLALDAAGALVPHGVGGHARALLSAAALRLTERAPAMYLYKVRAEGQDHRIFKDALESGDDPAMWTALFAAGVPVAERQEPAA